MRAVFVELGTNDTSNVWSASASYAAQRDKIINYLKLTAEYLRGSGKCIVLMGVDANGNGAIDPVMGRLYNSRAQGLATGNVHYANYSAFITNNAIYRNGLYQGAERVHPKTNAAKEQLAIWERDQLRWFCGI